MQTRHSRPHNDNLHHMADIVTFQSSRCPMPQKHHLTCHLRLLCSHVCVPMFIGITVMTSRVESPVEREREGRELETKLIAGRAQ